MFVGNFHKEKSEPGESKKPVQTEGGPVLPRLAHLYAVEAHLRLCAEPKRRARLWRGYKRGYDASRDVKYTHSALGPEPEPAGAARPAAHAAPATTLRILYDMTTVCSMSSVGHRACRYEGSVRRF